MHQPQQHMLAGNGQQPRETTAGKVAGPPTSSGQAFRCGCHAPAATGIALWKRVATGQPRHIRGHGPYAAHTLANSCHEVEAIPIVCAQSASTTCSLPPLRGRVVPPCHGHAAIFTGLQVLHVTHFLGELLRDALESPIDLGGKGHLPTCFLALVQLSPAFGPTCVYPLIQH